MIEHTNAKMETHTLIHNGRVFARLEGYPSADEYRLGIGIMWFPVGANDGVAILNALEGQLEAVESK